MKCLILAAGYATRLYPLTENFPKPLLEVGGKPILNWLTEDIETTGKVNEYIVVTNHKFAHFFEKWANELSYNITVVDDGTESNETRLGAVKDIDYAIKKLHIEDELIVIAGDNLLDFSMNKFVRYFREKLSSCVMRYYEEDEKRLKKSGVIEIDENDRIIGMEEKPENPKSHWCCPPFYFLIRHDVELIEKAIEFGCSTDAPGSYIAWLSKRTEVNAMEMPGKRYDIGNIESYNDVQREYKGIVNE